MAYSAGLHVQYKDPWDYAFVQGQLVLNDAHKLAGKVHLLDVFEQFVIAVGSGKVEHIDRLSYTEEDELRGLLFWKLGGAQLAGVAYRSMSLPSLNTLCTRITIPHLIISLLSSTAQEVQANIEVLMFDELKIEERPCWNNEINHILGLCCEHGEKVSLEFCTENEVDLLIEALCSNEVHLAVEATVGALGAITEHTCMYSAHLILVSGSCKCEKGAQHAKLIETTYNAAKTTKLRTISIASDGESSLSSTSNIYSLLAHLSLLDLQVGDDDITSDKNYKHHGRILEHINYLMNPADKQDVKLAFDLLHAIWMLPALSADSDVAPSFCALFCHIMMPYMWRLVHLSAAAHLLMVLVGETELVLKVMPSQLYIDIMIMIKNAYFCVAKAKVDAPGSKLEVLFGILRTIIGNDSNADIYQLGLWLTGTMEVSLILATHPDWDRAPRCLKLPTLSKDSFEIHDSVDYVNPAFW
ncbi:hypothetical protein BDQ17DRAFT_1388467 [Cyathus striatus]|nr:hypothetical protein BDQ17DRAFT_1388467 [Cyathus striatus]